MTTKDDEPRPPLGSAGNAVLGAAGEAAAFLTGAPIAGAGDAAVGLGEVAAGREALLEQAMTGRHDPATPGRSWLWLVLGAIVVVAALAWALKG